MSGINRRAFLKGLGTMMAVPALESIAPVGAIAQVAKRAATPPVRMAFLFTPNGVDIPTWTPAKEGLGFDLPYILEPLKEVQPNLNVLTGLAQHNAFALGDGPGDHARSTAAWLTGVHPRKTAGADIKNGISADQVAAQKIGYKTRFPSLEIGCERSGVSGDCDSGYSCAYSSNISWRSENTPMAKEINPRLVFERLFGNGDTAEGEESLTRRNLFRQSILDFVSEDARSLRGRLGSHDKQKLDEYLAGIREIEERLVKFEQSAGMWAVKAGVEKPSGVPGDYGEHIRLMGDMMILAFQADLTRISTFMFANDGNNRSFREIGVPEGHHDMSHHGKDAHKVEQKRKIDRFHVEQLAYMLRRMQSIKEGNGTLLDNCMIVYGAGISDGDRHNHDDLPVILAGKAGGRIQTGRHMRFPSNTPMNNLFLTMLDRVGVDVETLGDSTGKLQGLF